MEKVVVQQGDLILEVAKIPKEAKKVSSTSGHTLLRGEGVNTHDLLGDFAVYEHEGTIYLDAQNVKLAHDEHGTTTIPKKTYRRVIEREFDYEEMEARETRD